MPRNAEANREYMRRYYQEYEQRKRGHKTRVAADLVLAHVHRCLDADMTRQQIATAAGVAVSTINRLLRGETTSVRESVARNLLAVRSRRPITPTGLTRRVRALAAIGWSITKIAEAAGVDRGTVQYYRKGGGTVLRPVTLRLVDAYDKLSMRTPPTATRHEKAVFNGTRSRALKAGWAPPLAWDDEAIDDPAAAPDLGSTSKGFDIDDWLMLVRSGEDWERAAERCGVTLEAVWTRAHRTQRDDVLDVLRQLRRAA